MSQSIRWLGFGAGLFLVAYTGSSVVRSLIVPRGLASFLAGALARAARGTFLFISNRFETYEAKDRIIALQAPFYLLALLFTWLTLFVFGFALLLWPLISQSFGDALLESGSSMFTLGYAGTHSVGPTILHFLAAATGLAVMALMIAYLPTIYSAFNRRETVVTMLQSRAGAPAWGPEILVRHQIVGLIDELPDLYHEWERWAADVTESHTNYPVLIFFRSPHPLRSWILGLLAIMDAAALHLSLSPSSAPTQARLCLRMGFTCLRHIATFLRIPFDPDPMPTDPTDLTYEDFLGGVRRLEEAEFPMERSPEEAWPHFRGWRVNYEQLSYAIADLVVAPPGPWSGERSHLPDMAIVPERPPNRSPADPTASGRPKAERAGWHA